VTSELIQQSCEACRADAPKVTDEELSEFIKQIPEWQPITEDNILKLRRAFKFDDYLKAARFTSEIASMSEEEGHHPAILLEWGSVEVTWWSHKIGGLHKNDFISAAKTDNLRGLIE